MNPEALLNEACTDLLRELHTRFNPRRMALLQARQKKQKNFDAGQLPDFLDDTIGIRQEDWIANSIPSEVSDRRTEITGPVDRKMIVNALNSGANVFMADFEDSNSPTWDNCIQGQINIYDAVRRTIDFVDSQTGKSYALNEKVAVLMVRPRGWHLDEAHFRIADTAISASLFDAALFLYHNAKVLIDKGHHPYLYIPKLESYEEAQLWEDVLQHIEEHLGIAKHSIKVTVLIETICAAFEMDEIIYALRQRIIGLNCGRWDYIFSYIKKFRKDQTKVLPDRQQVTMTTPFLDAYVKLLVSTCHRRNIHAMGGMAAQIPVKTDEKANEEAMLKVKADKLREVKAGHDGTWVAHPGLVSVAKDIFDTYMPEKNQISRAPDKIEVSARDLLAAPVGSISEEGVRNNISVALHYLRSWLAGNGCVPVNYLMEDAATAEICRAQLWQWLRFESPLEDGRRISKKLMMQMIDEEYTKIDKSLDTLEAQNYLEQANALLGRMIFNDEFADFLTLEAYSMLINGRS